VEKTGKLWAVVALRESCSESGDTPPRVFCKRVRKILIGKGLAKYSFLKSAEVFEKEEVNFSLFLQKSERGHKGRGLNAETQSARRIGEEGTGIGRRGESRRVLRRAEWQPNMRNGSMILAICQILY